MPLYEPRGTPNMSSDASKANESNRSEGSAAPKQAPKGERSGLGRPASGPPVGTTIQPSRSLTEKLPEDRESGSVVDRRVGLDRRLLEDSADSNLERRRGPGRRLTDFVKSAEEGEMNQEQFLFLLAIDTFKRANGKTFPTWTDVLEIIRKLGYRKTAPSELNLGARAQDWTEKPDAPSGVWKEAREQDEAVELKRKAA
jgi:hypothetical protein